MSSYLVSLKGQVCWSEEGGRWWMEAVMCLSLLVCAKAAGRKSLLRTGRQWPAAGAPIDKRERRQWRRRQRGSPGLWEWRDKGRWCTDLYGKAVCYHHDDQWDEEGHERANQHKALLVEDTASVNKDLVLVVEADHWDWHRHTWREEEGETVGERIQCQSNTLVGSRRHFKSIASSDHSKNRLNLFTVMQIYPKTR